MNATSPLSPPTFTPAVLPPNEAERLRALRELDVLDTSPEESFDRITRMVSATLGTPIALVSLVDESRQWFKSRVGLGAPETPREVAFCAHAILGDELFVVPDATRDPRFSQNPLVLDDPSVRFYAGAPLCITPDVRVGTLCAIDREPRELTEAQAGMLRDLAEVVVDELRLRRRVAELSEARAELAATTRTLRHANEALEQFAYAASHDLRSPLKTLINLADLAADDPHPEAYVTTIRDTAVKMERVVEGYRRLSRLQPFERTEVVALDVLCREASRDAGLRVDLAAPTAALECEPTLFSQVFHNLFENAQRYGTDGRAEVDVERRGAETVVHVSNATDLPGPVDDRIFAPFRRVHAGGDGTGLGLALVRRIVQLHQGQVSARCEGQRFTVSIRLPVAARPPGSIGLLGAAS